MALSSLFTDWGLDVVTVSLIHLKMCKRLNFCSIFCKVIVIGTDSNLNLLGNWQQERKARCRHWFGCVKHICHIRVLPGSPSLWTHVWLSLSGSHLTLVLPQPSKLNSSHLWHQTLSYACFTPKAIPTGLGLAQKGAEVFLEMLSSENKFMDAMRLFRKRGQTSYLEDDEYFTLL